MALKIFRPDNNKEDVPQPTTPSSYPSAPQSVYEVPSAHIPTPVAPSPTPSTPTYTQMGAVKNMLNADVEVKGKLKFTDDLLIDGVVEGEISSNGTLTVGENARITASINTRSVIIYGKVYGNINVTDKIELKRTAELNGDVKGSSIAIEAGAIFIGRSEVGLVSTPQVAMPIPTHEASEPQADESGAFQLS